ncbi:MAG: hypothetical protein L0Z53_16780, partial [Acidobacteriales bacterium]|nr:hypothetical protein [Terriglobales bacterium]
MGGFNFLPGESGGMPDDFWAQLYPWLRKRGSLTPADTGFYGPQTEQAPALSTPGGAATATPTPAPAPAAPWWAAELQKIREEEVRAPAPIGWKRGLGGALATIAARIGSGPQAAQQVAEQIYQGPEQRRQEQLGKRRRGVVEQAAIEARMTDEQRAATREKRETERFGMEKEQYERGKPDVVLARKKQEAESLGLKPGTPEYNEYVSGRDLGYRPTAPRNVQTETFLEGGRRVLKQYNPETGQWNEIGQAPSPKESTAGEITPRMVAGGKTKANARLQSELSRAERDFRDLNSPYYEDQAALQQRKQRAQDEYDNALIDLEHQPSGTIYEAPPVQPAAGSSVRSPA